MESTQTAPAKKLVPWPSSTTSSQQLVKLFDAAGHISGLSVGLTAVTNNGTATMGISWGVGSEEGTLLYNPKTLAYLGGQRVSGGEQAAIEQTIVDNVGDTS